MSEPGQNRNCDMWEWVEGRRRLVTRWLWSLDVSKHQLHLAGSLTAGCGHTVLAMLTMLTSGGNVSQNNFARRGCRAGTVDRSTRPCIPSREAGDIPGSVLGWGKSFYLSGPRCFLICKMGGWGCVGSSNFRSRENASLCF